MLKIRQRKKLRAAGLVLSLLILMTFCRAAGAASDSCYIFASDAWEDRPFIESSPFNTPIPDNAEVEPNSQEIVNNMVNSMSGGELFVGVDLWSVPVFFANSSTPRQDVDITDQWAIWDIMEDVPIPDNAVPDPEDDGHLCIIDNDTRIEYDFWRAEKTHFGWQAEWGNKISLDSEGIYLDNWGARGSGFALAAGLIFPDEIARGSIGHALVYSTDWEFVKSGGPVRPATTSDGISNESLAIPEGARLQLAPDIDLDSLGMNQAAYVIARAMQEYGMFLCDNGGGHQVYAYNPINSQNSWDGILPTDEDGISWIFESKISITDFRVLKLGPQIPNPHERESLPPYTLYTLNGDEIVDSRQIVQIAVITIVVLLSGLYLYKRRR